MQARRIATLVAGGVVVAAFAATAALATGSAPDTTVPKGQVVEDVVVRPTEVLPQNQDLVVQTTTVVPMQPAEQPVAPVPAPAPQAVDDPTTTEPPAPTFTHPPFIPTSDGHVPPPPPEPPLMCRVMRDGRAVEVPPLPDGTCPIGG